MSSKLDLSGCRLDEEALDSLVKGKERLAHLREVILRRVALPNDSDGRLRELDNAVVEEKDDDQPDFYFRYVATSVF